nr:endonuclease/exonuclease/phosphatase family protein [Candidatus Sigynarchaeota archaeon]
MLGICGGINPRLSDDFFEFLFPAGYQGLIWPLIFLAAAIALYLLAMGIHGYHSRGNSITREVLGTTACAAAIGILCIPGCVAIVLYIILKAARHLRADARVAPRNPQKQVIHKLTRFGILFFAFFLCVIVVLVPVAGILLATLAKYATIGWSTIAGAAFGIAAFLVGSLPLLSKYLGTPRATSRGKKILGVVAIAIPVLLGSTLIVATFGKTYLPIPAPSSIETSLKIVTYNIRNGIASELNPANNWINRKADVASYLDGMDADVIGVQEAYLFQLADLLSGMASARYQFTGHGRDDGVHYGEHAAIIFNTGKLRLVDGDTFWLSDCTLVPSKSWDPSNYRICTWARFEVLATGAQFCVFCTHYGFGVNFSALASTLICDRITQHTGDLPTFAMGDFNMRNTSQGYAIFENFTAKPMKDSYRLAYGDSYPWDTSFNNWTAPGTSSRIDFVFCSPGINVSSATVPKDVRANNQTYSDHYPVVVQCSF